MAGQKNLKREVAVMLDRKKILHKITKNRKFSINVMEPFNNFINRFFE